MNPFKFNGIAGYLTRTAICKKLNISPSEIYKQIDYVDFNDIIVTKTKKKYKLILKRIKE